MAKLRNADPLMANRQPVPFRVSGALASGCLLQPLNSSMISVAIVAIAVQFGASAGTSWVISAMYIATAVGGPTAGRLGSLFGARRVFIGGLLLAAVGSVSGMLAPSSGWLIASYFVLGLGISAHMPNAMTMIRSFVERYGGQSTSALTVLAVFGQSLAALGPTIGGLLVGTFGWQAILWVNLPVVALSAGAVIRADVGYAGGRTTSMRETVRALDVLGIALFLVTITAIMLLLVSLREQPVWWPLPLAVGGLVLFVWREWRAPEPFLDLRALVRNRALSTTLGRTLVQHTCFYCVFFGIPQWLQYARSMSAGEAGMAMLPLAAASTVATIIGARLYVRAGARWPLLLGGTALLVGGILVAVFERSTTSLWVLLLVAIVLGVQHGFNTIGNQNLLNEVTSVDEVGIAMGMYRTLAFIGANVALVVLQLAAGPQIDDTGMQRVGVFIALTASVMLIGVIFSRNMGTSSMGTRALRSPSLQEMKD